MVTQQRGVARDYGIGGTSRRQDDGLDLRGLLKILRRRRMLIIAVIVLLTSAAAATAFSLTPRYTVVASVLLDQQESRIINTQEVVERPTSSSLLVAEINLLRSHGYAERVVGELNLLADAEFNVALQSEPDLAIAANRLLSKLAAWLPDPLLIATGFAEPSHELGSAQGQTVYDEGLYDEETQRLLKGAAVGIVLEGLQVEARSTNVIVVQYTSTNPQNAALIANKIAEIYVKDQLDINRATLEGAIGWLNERVTELRDRVLRSEEAVENYREEHGLVGTREADGPGQELALLRSERAKKEALLRWVEGEPRGRALDLETIAAVLALPSLNALRQQELKLVQDETLLRMKYGEQHREIVQLDAGRHPINVARQHLDAQVRQEIQRAIRSLEGEIAFLEHRERELEQRLQQAESDTIGENRADVRLRDLSRQAEADRSLYVAFLARYKEVTQQRNLLDSGAKLGALAGVPTTPTFPKPGLMTAGGFATSLLMAVALAFVLEYFDNGMRTRRQVERVLGIPHLGFVPHERGKRKLHEHLLEKPSSAYAEAIRSIQIATLDPGEPEMPMQVVLVTSSLPGEGKTTLAMSLGAAAALSGLKTAILDVDLRRPRLQDYLHQSPQAGLVELLLGQNSLEEVLQPACTTLSRFDLLPVKSIPNNPADLIRSPKMNALIQYLRTQYDYIIIDSTPLLGIADAKLLARLADVVLFVVRWEKTNEVVARTALDSLLDGYAPPLGAVLTQVDMRRHAKGRYGDVIQYHKRYERYYDVA